MGKELWRRLDPEMADAAGALQVTMGDPIVLDGGLNVIGPTGLITGFLAFECCRGPHGEMCVKIQLRGAGGEPVLIEWEHPMTIFEGRVVTLPFAVGVTVILDGGD